MDMLEKARAEGLDFRCDRYPYIAGATGLGTLFPIWSREGGTEGLPRQAQGPGVRRPDPRPPRRAGEGLRLVGQGPHLGRGLRTRTAPSRGLNVLEAAARAGKAPYEFMRDLLIEEADRVGMVSFYGHEDDLERILSPPARRHRSGQRGRRPLRPPEPRASPIRAPTGPSRASWASTSAKRRSSRSRR